MKLYKEQIELTSHGKTPSYFDITPQVKEAIAKSGVKEGICTVLTAHTTCSVFFEEFVHDYTEDGDEFLQVDLNNVLEKTKLTMVNILIQVKNTTKLLNLGQMLKFIFQEGTELNYSTVMLT